MYESNLIQVPSRTDREYVIYFYESGLSVQYQQRGRKLSQELYNGFSTVYDFTSDLVNKGEPYKNLTVEQIVAHGYFAVPKSDPVEAIISDKKHTSKLGLDDVIGQIRHRYQVYQRNIYEIELSKCAAINSFYTHEAWHGPSNSKVEYSLNKRLDNLYRDQRVERADLWRDVSKLRLLLPEQAQQYLSAYRKVSILEDKEGDTP